MSYQQVTDFRLGLNASRFLLNLPEGSLVLGNNLHLTPGAECEKRKAFVPIARPAGTFGAESSPSGIYTFGSREVSWAITGIQVIGGGIFATITQGVSGYLPNNGDSLTVSGTVGYNGTYTLVGGGGSTALQLTSGGSGARAAESTGTTALNLNAPLIYQQLLHPDGVTQMTGVVSSVLFGPYPWVIALFADGNEFEYYDGVLVEDFYAGLGWSGGYTGFDIATNLAAVINAGGIYKATAPALPGSLSLSLSAGVGSTAAIAATGTYASFGTPAVNDTVTIDSVTYTFVTTLDNATPYQVSRIYGGSALTNLFNAINAGSGSGVEYSSATTAHPTVVASSLNTYIDDFMVTAITAGAAGNSIATTATFGVFLNGLTLSGGADAITTVSEVTGIFYHFPVAVPLGSIGSDQAQIVAPPQVYTFVNALNNDGLHPNQVQIGANAAATLQSLFYAINGTGTPGTDYSAGTIINLFASAGTLMAGSLVATALFVGVAGNNFVTASGSSALAWTGALMTGGTGIAAAASTLTASSNPANGDTLTLGGVGYLTSLTVTAAAVAAVINNATDYYGGGNGTNMGFLATSSGSTVTVTPPVAQTAKDYLIATGINGMHFSIPAPSYALLVQSVPTAANSSPFTVSDTVSSANGSVTPGLVNVGSPIVPATFATGSFAVSACNISTQASAVLQTNGTNVGAGNTVTIGGTVYTFVTTLAGAAINSVLIGANALASMTNLASAITASAIAGFGSGTLWAAGTAPNPDVTSGAIVSAGAGVYYFAVTAILGGASQNALTLSANAPSLSWLVSHGGAAATALAGGTDTNYISTIEVGAVANILSGNVVSSSNNPVTLANGLATAINDNSDTSGYSASAVNGTVYISSTVAGAAFNGENIVVTAVGAVCVDQYEFIVSGSYTQTITSITVAGGANLLSATMTFTSPETLTAFCARVVANINARTGTSGFVAASLPNSAVISLSRNVSSGLDAATAAVAFAGTLTETPVVVSMTVTPSPAYTAIVKVGHTIGPGSRILTASAPVTALVAGGVSPYSYQFARASGSPNFGFILTSPTPATAVWQAGPSLLKGTEQWICAVTDSTSPTPLVVNSSVIQVTYAG